MSNSHSCLVVEDSPTQAMALQALLQRHNYEVRVAENGRRALDVLEEFLPSVVLSDIVMPEMDGLELCRKLKSDERFRHLSVMLLTNLSEPEDVFRALECGADNFVTKPADESQLIHRLEYLIANQKIHDEESLQAGIEVKIGERRQFITSSRLQILNLLLSSYDVAVQKNRELEAATAALREANDSLEMKVTERTAHLEQEVARRREAEALLHRQARLATLLEAAAAAANQGRNSQEVVEEILKTTCLLIRWPLGHFYACSRTNDKELYPSTIWHSEFPDRFAPFIDDTSQTLFEPGVGFIGRVAQSGVPEWISDISKDHVFTRRGSAESAGLSTAVAVPVKIGDRVVGVLEFYHQDVKPVDRELMNALSQEAFHLGRMFEREAASQALAESEAFLQSILDHSTAVIYVKDREGRYITVNRRFQALFNLDRNELRGKTDYELFPRRVADSVVRNDKAVLRAGAPMEFEEYVGMNGDQRTYISLKFPMRDDYGKIFAIAGHSTDITERIRAEEDRRLMSEAVNQAQSGIAIVSKSGEIVFANRSLIEMCGVDKMALRKVSDLKWGRTESSHESLEDIWTSIRTSKKDRVEADFSRCGPSGDRVWSLRISQVRDRENKTTHFLFVLRDITEERALERQIQRKHRLESIGTLAGGIAHDFNNILSAVLGYAELAQANVENHEQVLEDLSRVLSAGQRARVLIQQILRFSRSERGVRVAVDLGHVVDDVLGLAKAAVPATVTITRKVDPRCSNVPADPSQIEQVLLNIITNASHAIGNRPGWIELCVEPFTLEESDDYIHPDLKSGEYMRIAVKDSGCGMSQNTIDHIFDPFFTTKGPAEGTGLGLSNSHAIIREHEGAITVYSEEGVGTEFHIYLPVGKVDAPVEAAPSPSPEVLGGSEHVLVVDDVETLALLTKRRLETAGYQVTSTTSPEEALKFVQADTARFNLIITDSAMPRMTGEQLAGNVYDCAPDIPVLILSGYSAKVSTDPLPRNVKGYLAKPLPQGQLLASVRQVLEGGSAIS